MEAILGLLALVFLLICSALFSGSEVAFFSLNPVQLDKLKDKNSDKSNELVDKLLGDPKRLLATLLISNNVVNVAIVVLSTLLSIKYLAFPDYPWLATTLQVVAVTFLIVLFGEVMPKVYATKIALSWARFMSVPLNALEKILKPFVYLLVATSGIVDKRLKSKGYDVTVDDLEHAIEITSDQTTPANEKRILKRIANFGDIDVKQIMKSRADVISYDVETKFHDLVKSIEEAGYSRVPIYQENFDKVIGTLHIKDLLAHLDKNDDFNWRSLLRKPYFVPESKKLNDLLTEFQEKKGHLAIVIDEYGGSSGIVTLEDVLEEIIGEMSDEFDDDESLYSKLDEHNYVFEAKTLINDMCRIMKIDRDEFEEVLGEADTLAGMLLELSGKIPSKNEIINYNQFKFKIESADSRKINRVKITIDPLVVKQKDENKSS
ncbi:MAG: gliding motility-associated protein GldE [Bacteroidia bacterium]|nr:gliding motility-associated protein GldE [Bacteroidia bacterium]NNM16215.1 gliding motility-associated protein GldE [Bacteroidia bacterium]